MLRSISNDFGHSQDLFQHCVPSGHAPFGAKPWGDRMHSQPGREIVFLQRMLTRENIWQMVEYVFL